MKFLQTSRIWVGCPRTLSGILCQAMSLCLSLCSTTVLICFPHHQSASSLRAGPAFSSLHSQDWQVASAYEMFVEKVATGIYVFLVTAVVESFPLHMFHKNTYLKKKKIFFFFCEWSARPFHCFPFSCAEKTLCFRTAPQWIPCVSVLTADYLFVALESFSVNHAEWSTIPGQSHLSHQPKQTRRDFLLHDTPDRSVSGKGVSHSLNL